jgi:hypothetical protein
VSTTVVMHSPEWRAAARSFKHINQSVYAYMQGPSGSSPAGS